MGGREEKVNKRESKQKEDDERRDRVSKGTLIREKVVETASTFQKKHADEGVFLEVGFSPAKKLK